MTSRALLAFYLTVIFFSSALGSSVETPASFLAGAFKGAVVSYMSDNNGSTAGLTAEGLNKRLNLEMLRPLAKGEFWDRFQLYEKQSITDPRTAHRIIAVTSYEVFEDRRLTKGRYVIWLNAKTLPPRWESRVWASWEPEERVMALFGSVGVVLINKGVWKQPASKYLNERAANPDGNDISSEVRRNQELKRQDESISRPSVVDGAGQTGSSVPVPQPPAPKEGSEVKPTTPASNEKPLSSNSWSVIVILIVAATGLWWWLIKKRS